MEWPLYLPDLDPIKHAWVKLKDAIYKLDPDLVNARGSSEEVRKSFRELIKQA